MVINFSEICVKNYLEKVFKNDPNYSNLCKCQQCMDDIMAKALNNIRPYYITSKKGEVYAEYSSLEYQNQAEIIQEVIRAIEFVSKNKSHE